MFSQNNKKYPKHRGVPLPPLLNLSGKEIKIQKMKKQIFTFLIAIATVISFAQCPTGQTEVSIDISTDNWGFEIYWELTPTGNTCGSGSTIFSGGNTAVGCNANSASSGGYANGTLQ